MPVATGIPVVLCAYHPDPVVVAVSDVDIALAIDIATVGAVHRGLGGGTVITLSAQAAPHYGGDHPSRNIYAPDRMVFSVHHQNVVLAIATYAFGRPPSCLRGQPAVPSIAALAGSRQCAHNSIGINDSDPVALPFRDVGVPAAVPAYRTRP